MILGKVFLSQPLFAHDMVLDVGLTVNFGSFSEFDRVCGLARVKNTYRANSVELTDAKVKHLYREQWRGFVNVGMSVGIITERAFDVKL